MGGQETLSQISLDFILRINYLHICRCLQEPSMTKFSIFFLFYFLKVLSTLHVV